MLLDQKGSGVDPDPTIIILDPSADYFVITKIVCKNFVLFTLEKFTSSPLISLILGSYPQRRKQR